MLEKRTSHHFYGDASEFVGIQRGVVRFHVRMWHDGSVVPRWERVARSRMIGRPVGKIGRRWTPSEFEADEVPEHFR